MSDKINLRGFMKDYPPVLSSADMNYVFELFRSNRDYSFFPVLDDAYFPLGIVREFDLKPFAYGMFGRELIKHEKLENFITRCPVAGIDTRLEDILTLSIKTPQCHGIIITEKSRYCGVLPAQSILALFEENRKSTQRRLMQSQKMEAIGTLAGGIAHDFNNILTPIRGYAELIKQFGIEKSGKNTAEYLEQILVATSRAKELVNQILSFSRQKDREKVALHLGSIIKEVSKLLRSSLPSTITIETEINTHEDVIHADPTEIHQVIMNLYSNAEHAMRSRGGTLTISLASHSGPPVGYTVDTSPLPSPCICLSVQDTGPGIPSGILDRIFDPFFTTKKQGEGTGMGLSVVHGIVKNCNGAIAVETETSPGRSGARFNIYFPRFSEFKNTVPDSPSLPELSSRLPSDRTFHVLCVDDELVNVEMIHEMLACVGFEVTAKDNSVQALIAFNTNPGQFDLVITDQTMPGLTGMELSKKLFEIRPDIPIILITGFSETVSAEIAQAIGIRNYLTKPLNLTQLAEIAIDLVLKKESSQ